MIHSSANLEALALRCVRCIDLPITDHADSPRGYVPLWNPAKQYRSQQVVAVAGRQQREVQRHVSPLASERRGQCELTNPRMEIEQSRRCYNDLRGPISLQNCTRPEITYFGMREKGQSSKPFQPSTRASDSNDRCLCPPTLLFLRSLPITLSRKCRIP